ncbi:MAG: carboxylate-amine ligase [Longimicrobiales bacterium]
MNEYSIGVEEEYQLVDPESGALRSRARDVLETDWSAELTPEALETTIEVGTSICGSAAALSEELRRLRVQVGTAAAAEGLEMVAAGLHPYARWESQRGTRGERYVRIQQRYGLIAEDENKFGTHIHVQVTDPAARITAFNAVRGFLPHLLALSASSPIYEGRDTDYASYRAVLWRRWPFAGMPPRFEDQSEHDRFVERLVETGTVMDRWNIYWSLRLHPEYPTLEFRVMDACPRVEDTVGIAALARALVLAALEGDLPTPGRASESLEHQIHDANEWAAARFGLEAKLVGLGEGTVVGMRTAIRRVIDRVARHAERLGDGEALGYVVEILERGNAAERMRRELTELAGLEPLVAWLAGETRLGTGLDRRHAQRAEGRS